MMNLLSFLKRITGSKTESVVPIIDRRIYNQKDGSACGGSLSDSNVVLVYNDNNAHNVIKESYAKEGCYLCDTHVDKVVSFGILDDLEKEMVGNIDHIVNIINEEKTDDVIRQIYQLFQKEVPFLSRYTSQTSINTVIILEGNYDLSVIKSSIDKLIESLALLVGKNHRIIVNCVCSSGIDDDCAIANASIFMSSKYGEVLAGETLFLK